SKEQNEALYRNLSLWFVIKPTLTSDIYTLSLHDALPICHVQRWHVMQNSATNLDSVRAGVHIERQHFALAEPNTSLAAVHQQRDQIIPSHNAPIARNCCSRVVAVIGCDGDSGIVID